MKEWSYYPAFLGMTVSLVGLSYFALKHYTIEKPFSLSDFATTDKDAMRLFRIIVIPGTSLFALSVFFYILPRVTNVSLIAVVSAITLLSGILLALIPANAGKKLSLHGWSATIMSLSSLALVFIFSNQLTDWRSELLLSFGLIMILLIVFALRYPKKFLYFELPFIWLCNLSVLITVMTI
jgi:hypothetical protein